MRPDQTDFQPLMQAWEAYQAAMVAEPYDGDKVQGLGMRFCHLFKGEFKEPICRMFDIDPDEFSYEMRREVMEAFYE